MAAATAVVLATVTLALRPAFDGAATATALAVLAILLLASIRATEVLLFGVGALILAGALAAAGADALAESVGDAAFFSLTAGIVLALVPDRRHSSSEPALSEVLPDPPPPGRSVSRLGAVVTAAVLGVLALVPLSWFGPGEILNGNDTNYPLRAAHFVAVRLSTWNWEIGAGVSNLANLSTVTWGLLVLGLQDVTGSYVTAQRALLIIWFGAIPLSFAYLLRVLSGRWRLSHLPATLVYALNPYFVGAWSNALVATIGAGVALPLLLALGLRLAPAHRPWRLRLLLGWTAGSVLLSLVGQSPQLLVVVAAVVAAGVLWLGRPVAWTRAAALAAVAVGVNAFWLVPQLSFLVRTPGVLSTNALQALGQSNWTSGVSAHTSLFNVLRMAGSWDWFESWDKTPYVSYAHAYLHSPGLVIATVAVPALGFAALAFSRNAPARYFAAVAVVGLALSSGEHPPLGFFYRWGTDNLPLFDIFRSPWYKFGLATAFGYAGLVAAAGTLIAGRLGRVHREPPWRRAVPAVAIGAGCCIALAYGGPLLTGSVTLPQRRDPPGFRSRVPAYVTAAGDWVHRREPGARVLWTPRFSDVYRWGFATGVESLLDYASDASVVAEMPFSTSRAPDRALTLGLFDLLDERRADDVLSVARLLGVGSVIVRGDVDESFYRRNVETAGFLNRQLAAARGVRRVRSFGPWTVHALAPPPPRVYGSSSGTLVPGAPREVARAATFLPPESTTFVSAADVQPRAWDLRARLTDRVALARVGMPLSLAPGAAGSLSLLVKPLTARFAISVAAPRGRNVASLRQLPQTVRLGELGIEVPGGAVTRVPLERTERPQTAVLLDGELTPVPTTRSLSTGIHTIAPLAPASGNLLQDGSFEKGHWTDAIDAGPPPGRRAAIPGVQTASSVAGGVDGGTALRLSSTGDRAAVFEHVRSFEPRGIYRISFASRHEAGGGGSLTLVAGDGRVLLSLPVGSSTSWTRRELVYQALARVFALDVYLYTDSAGAESVNLFDDVRVVRLGSVASAARQLNLAASPLEVPLPALGSGRLATAVDPISPNLVADGSFERGHWVDAIDAGPPPGVTSAVTGRQIARRVPGGTDGSKALELVSTGDRAAVFQSLADDARSGFYRVDLDYRHISGGRPSFALVAGGHPVLHTALERSSRWTHRTLLFQADERTSSLDLYLYSNSAGERTVNRFDNVDVRRLGGNDDLLLRASRAARPVELETERIRPTHYRVRVLRAPLAFLLTLRENYDSGWAATSRSATIGSHFRSDAYANGWVVSGAGAGTVIDLSYRPQRLAILGRLLTAATIIVVLLAAAAVVAMRLRRRR